MNPLLSTLRGRKLLTLTLTLVFPGRCNTTIVLYLPVLLTTKRAQVALMNPLLSTLRGHKLLTLTLTLVFPGWYNTTIVL